MLLKGNEEALSEATKQALALRDLVELHLPELSWCVLVEAERDFDNLTLEEFEAVLGLVFGLHKTLLDCLFDDFLDLSIREVLFEGTYGVLKGKVFLPQYTIGCEWVIPARINHDIN